MTGVPFAVTYWVTKAILTPVFLLLWRIRVEGRANVPRKGAAVLAANHQSFCDSFFLPLVLARRVTYLAKAEYFDSWHTAWFFRSAGQIPIRRGGGDRSQRALETAAEVLRAGGLLALYPEGTRAEDAQVHRGRTGVARLAIECGVPVVPVGIVGTEEVQPIGSRLMRPFRTVTVRFGPPITAPVRDSPSAAGPEACRDYTDKLMQTIAELSGRPYIDEYVARSADPPTAHRARVS